jgi:hypothetical protein
MQQNKANEGKITVVATHPSPHMDEAMAVALLRKYVPEAFGDEVRFDFVGAGRMGGAENNGADGLEVLALGVLGGFADEHAPGMEKECSATLVASHFNLHSLALQIALAPILRMDRSGDHQPEIGQAMKRVARYSGLPDLEVLEWGIVAATALLCESEELANGYDPQATNPSGRPVKEPKVSVETEKVVFYVHKHLPEKMKTWGETLAKAEEGRKKEWEEALRVVAAAQIAHVGGRRLVTVRSDCREAANASRHTHQHDVVLILKKNGHRQIMTAGQGSHEKLDLRPLVGALRQEEMRARQLPELSEDEAFADNSTDTVPWWFAHVVDGDMRRVGSVFNGTQDSGVDIEPTRLNDDTVVRVVTEFLRSLPPVQGGAVRHNSNRRPDQRGHHGRQDHAGNGGGRHNDRRQPRRDNGNDNRGRQQDRRGGQPPQAHAPVPSFGGDFSLENAFKNMKTEK